MEEEEATKRTRSNPAKPRFSKSCRHCSRFLIIPLHEGQLNTCHWVGNSEKENAKVHTGKLTITFTDENGNAQEYVPHLYRIKKGAEGGYCEFYKPK